MATYSTFFVCERQKLSSLFPGWQPPLPEPIVRESKNPFTGQGTRVSTREHDWPEEAVREPRGAPLEPLSIRGSYEEYLEDRFSGPLRDQSHWCSKGLAQVELEPLGRAVNVVPALQAALYSPPLAGALLEELRPELVAKLTAVNDNALREIAKRWAAIMSDREHTHSETGKRALGGWSLEQALEILQPLSTLARKASSEQRLYLLIET